MPIRLPRWAARILKGRKDRIIFGAWAVNLHLPKSDRRMTSDVDIMTPDAKALAMEIAQETGGRVMKESEFCFTVKKKGIVLADVFVLPPYYALPDTIRISGYHVVSREFLIRQKMAALKDRKGTPKGYTDQRDLMLLQQVKE